MYISFLLLLFAYVHVIHILSEHMHIMRTLSAVVLDIFLPNSCLHLHIICSCTCHPHIICSTPQGQCGPKLSFYSDRIQLLNGICLKNVGHMHIMRTLFAVVLDIFLPNRQCQCHPYVISSTLYISYHVQLSFCTLSAQMYIVHVICMLSTHVHIICLSSLPLLIYLIIHNLVSINCLHTCILSMSSVYCLEMHMLCTCHLYCCYLYMYMSSTYYLGIYVLCAHYLKWSSICSFLTDNTNVIHTSSLVLFIYSIMYNLVSAHCSHRCTLSMSFACCPHMYTSFAFHL